MINDISDSELRDAFREAILSNNQNINESLLQKQIDFMVDRTNNFGNETLSESEISDQAHKLGLCDNNFTLRKIPNYEFSQQ